MAIFYVLKPGTWAESGEYLCRPLLNPRTSPVPVPFVALGSGVVDGDYQLIRRQELTLAQAQTYIQEAQEQLESQEVSWQVADQEGLFFKKPATVRAIVFPQTAPTLNLSDKFLVLLENVKKQGAKLSSRSPIWGAIWL
jgi:hypothetical protein